MKKGILFSTLVALTAITQMTSASGLLQYKSDYVVSDYAKTKYPIVFAHGFLLGFTRLGTENFGVDQLYQIAPDLARNGATLFAAQLSPVNSTEVRGEQLLQQVDEVIALTGKTKVNLIGHSHGGPTVQYVEVVAPEKVASATGIAGAYRGSKVGDVLESNPILYPVAKVIMANVIAPVIQALEGNPDLPIDAEAAKGSLTTDGANQFQANYPSAAVPKDCQSNGQKITANGIYHYSWVGAQPVTNVLDVVETLVDTFGGAILAGQSNDGLVTACSAKYGQVIRSDYNWSHFDEINQVLGIKGLFSQDPVAVFRQHANRLKQEGL